MLNLKSRQECLLHLSLKRFAAIRVRAKWPREAFLGLVVSWTG